MLLGAYTEGVFPMAEAGEILWFSPLKRGLIPLDERLASMSKEVREELRLDRFAAAKASA